MSRKLVAVTAAFLVAGVSFAYAATAQHETGVIAKIDTMAPSITLKTGKIKTFWLDKTIDVSTLTVGEKVLVTYAMTDKKPMASAVAASVN
jgi:hypothetical protein